MQLYQYFSVFFLFALVRNEPEVFLPKYSQIAILHAAHFRRVVEHTYSGEDGAMPGMSEVGRKSRRGPVHVSSSSGS